MWEEVGEASAVLGGCVPGRGVGHGSGVRREFRRHEWMGRDKRSLLGEREDLSPSGGLLHLREVGG